MNLHEPRSSVSPSFFQPLAVNELQEKLTLDNFVNNQEANYSWIKEELRCIRESFEQVQRDIKEKSHRRDQEQLQGNGNPVDHLTEDLNRLHEVRCKLLDCQMHYCRLLEQQLLLSTPRQSLEYKARISSSTLHTSNELKLSECMDSLEVKTSNSLPITKNQDQFAVSQWFLMLPRDVVSTLLLEWLTLIDICRLDSAMCAHNLRDNFLNVIRSDSLLFEGLADDDYEEEMTDLNEWGEVDASNTLDLALYLQWLNNRKVKVKNIKICASMKRRGIHRLVSNDSDDQILMVRFTKDFTSHGTVWSPLKLLTQFTCSSLVTINLEGPLVLDDTIFVQAITYCTQLRRVYFDFTAKQSSSFHSAPASPVPHTATGFSPENSRRIEYSGLSDLAYMRLLYSCPQLTTLIVKGDNKLTGTMLKHINTTTVPQFHTLHICCCNNLLPVSLKQFIHSSNSSSSAPNPLTNFKIEDCSSLFGDEEAVALGASFGKTLRALEFGRCDHLSDLGVIHLVQQLDVLCCLEIVDCDLVTDSSITTVTNVKSIQQHLQFLHIEGSEGITADVLRLAISKLSGIEEIRLINCVNIQSLSSQAIMEDSRIVTATSQFEDDQDEARHVAYTSFTALLNERTNEILSIPSCTPHLKHIDMSHCTSLDDSILQYISVMCPQLCVLNLDLCEKITDSGLQFIGNGCYHLDTVSICGCEKVTSEGVLSLSRLCQKLRVLDVSMCTRLSDAFITGLSVVAPPALIYLGLMNCNITEHCIEDLFVLLHKCRNLRKLGFDSSDGMIANGSILLQAMFPDLDIR